MHSRLRSRVEVMEAAIPEKSHFMRISENVDMFPPTSGAFDIKIDVSPHVEAEDTREKVDIRKLNARIE